MPGTFFREPEAPRFISVYKETNTVHLNVTGLEGVKTGTANTCGTFEAMQNFFGLKESTATFTARPALPELEGYKEALEFDIALFPPNSQTRLEKQDRLDQINALIVAMREIQKPSRPELKTLLSTAYNTPHYPDWMKRLLGEKTNLLSMCLRPMHKDSELNYTAYVFEVKRGDDDCPFYHALDKNFTLPLEVKNPHPTDQLTDEVQKKFKRFSRKRPNFSEIQQAVAECARALYPDVDIDVYHTEKFDPEIDPVTRKATRRVIPHSVTQEEIEFAMGLDDETPWPSEEYIERCIDALMQTCCPGLWTTRPIAPFTVKRNEEGKQNLIVVTQFFLGDINLYCYAKKLSKMNFGAVLDNNRTLRNQVPQIVKEALRRGGSVEKALFDFVNRNYGPFGLKRPLDEDTYSQLEQSFHDHYKRLIGSPHYDEITELFDFPDCPGNWTTHQGSICIGLEWVVKTGYPFLDNAYFERARADKPERNVADENRFVNEISDAELSELLIYLASEAQDEQKQVQLAFFLLNPTSSGQFVFQKLDIDAILRLRSSPHWDMVHACIQARIEDDDVRILFENSFNQRQVTITDEMAAVLFSSTPDGHHELGNADSLRDVLISSCSIRERMSVETRASGFLITLSPEDALQLETILRANENKVYCSPEMVQKLYREAARLYGQNSDEIIRVDSLPKDQELKAVLDLLQIPVVVVNSALIEVTPETRRMIFKLIKVPRLTSAQLLQKFEQAISNLEQGALALRRTALASNAAGVADSLITELRNHVIACFQTTPSIGYLEFQRRCTGSIASRKTVLEAHYGWDALIDGFVFLINKLISTVTLSNVNSFFKPPINMLTQAKLNFEEALDVGLVDNSPP